eukprot:CAMPEP_0172628010 /NCGR_PEP_ID=MMETSP1068-20121228/159350_1 /TAXON_ID=35684 /ORGANISM="Pseudopedinella elastica, Strain CCMP716" /LENGTH=142 /DNA_ID=CAMNT_0013438059 /DNA_START=21 /DNA_END=447 /DNA_ORIENTATION=+
MAAADPSSASGKQQYRSAKRSFPKTWGGESAAVADDILRTTPGMENEMAELHALWEVYQERPAVGGLPSFVHVGTCSSKDPFEKFKASKDNPKKRVVVCLGNFPPHGAYNSLRQAMWGNNFAALCASIQSSHSNDCFGHGSD